MHIRVASRQSALALTQTRWVIDQLTDLSPQTTFDIIPIVTQGDKILDVSLSLVGGKGLFVSELEAALVEGRADMAVHSMKDVPARLADGLVLAGIPSREDARDVIISRNHCALADLPANAAIGTSSLRRMAQLQSFRSDFEIRPLRGNIDTRIKKLQSEKLDAIILAAAGLHRMGWSDVITEYVSVSVCLPAIAQGILGIECRIDDEELQSLLHAFTCPETARIAACERTLQLELNGSCQVPIAGYAQMMPGGQLWLRGLVSDPLGGDVVTAQGRGLDPVEVGCQVANLLMEQGARRILDDVRRREAQY